MDWGKPQEMGSTCWKGEGPWLYIKTLPSGRAISQPRRPPVVDGESKTDWSCRRMANDLVQSHQNHEFLYIALSHLLNVVDCCIDVFISSKSILDEMIVSRGVKHCNQSAMRKYCCDSVSFDILGTQQWSFLRTPDMHTAQSGQGSLIPEWSLISYLCGGNGQQESI